jgi:hypothetical protein
MLQLPQLLPSWSVWRCMTYTWSRWTLHTKTVIYCQFRFVAQLKCRLCKKYYTITRVHATCESSHSWRARCATHPLTYGHQSIYPSQNWCWKSWPPAGTFWIGFDELFQTDIIGLRFFLEIRFCCMHGACNHVTYWRQNLTRDFVCIFIHTRR